MKFFLAAARVSYHASWESNDTYGEIWNGVQFGVFQHRHYFYELIFSLVVEGDNASGLLP
jgi:hypothetical protein